MRPPLGLGPSDSVVVVVVVFSNFSSILYFARAIFTREWEDLFNFPYVVTSVTV